MSDLEKRRKDHFGARIRQVLILAGGKGSRLGEVSRVMPKALITVAGRPLLAHLLDWCVKYGFDDILICAGYLGHQIESFVQGHPMPSATVRVSIEPVPYGTAGSLHLIADSLQEHFLVLYGDVFLDFDPSGILASHQDIQPVTTLLVRASDHPWDSHMVDVGDDGWVREFISVREPGRLYRNLANAAVYACSRRILDFIPRSQASDFGANVFPRVLAEGGHLSSFELQPPGFVKDMGTPERLLALETWIEEREWVRQAEKEKLPIRTVFLDRDGTLNAENGLVTRREELHLLPGAAEAVKRLNQAGLKVIVVTNQAIIARGLCTVEELDAIHAKLREDLAPNGAHLDAIYFSPYHPETHHGEGLPELRRASRCRKPDIGMLMQAVRDLGVDLRSSVLVGNTLTDIETARNAGIRSILVQSPALASEGIQPDWHFSSLREAAAAIVMNMCT